MSDHTHYIPVLKGKEEEYRSLSEIDSATRARLTPLIEIPSVPWDFVNNEPAKSTEAYLAKVAEKIETSWGGKQPLFMELQLLAEATPTSDGHHPLSYVLDRGRSRGLQLIPVTGLKRDGAYQDAVRNAVAEDQRGVCIRIEKEDFEEMDDFDTELTELLGSFKLSPAETDVVLDFKEISSKQTSLIVLASRAILKRLPFVLEWRTLGLVASAFPENLSGFPPGEISTTPRAEWIVWESLADGRRTIPRLPTYGDYATAHAEITELDPAILRSHVNLRYTTDTNWLILKSRKARRNGHHEFNDLCRSLLKRAECKGPGFSWGDAYINACATNSASAVDPATWRMVSTTHHLAFVTAQIANFLNGRSLQ